VKTAASVPAAPGEPGFDWQDALFRGFPAAGDPASRGTRRRELAGPASSDPASETVEAAVQLHGSAHSGHVA
jgi:hypothetical protein